MKQILFIKCGGDFHEQLLEGLRELEQLSGEWTLAYISEKGPGEPPVPDAILAEADLIIRTRHSHRWGGPRTPTLRNHAARVVVVDSSNHAKRSVNVPVALYLKRQYHGKKQQPWASGPLTFCAYRKTWDIDPVPWGERTIGVFYAVCLRSNPIRKKILDLLDSTKDLGTIFCHGTFNKGRRLPWDHYIDLMRHSKIAISPHGSAQGSPAYWEIPASGVALLAQERTFVIPNNFVEGQEAVFFRDTAELPEIIRGLLADDVALEKMANRGRAKVLLHHTTLCRAKELMKMAKPFIR